LKEKEKIRYIISGEREYVTKNIELIFSLDEKIKLIYKKRETFLPTFYELEKYKKKLSKKSFLIDDEKKFWIFFPEMKVIVRYEEIPLIYEDLRNSKIKIPFFLFFTLTFLLLLYLISKLFGGFLSWIESKDKKISDFLQEVLEYPFLKDIEEKERKRKFFEIAEVTSLFSHEIKNSLQSLLSYLVLIKTAIKDELFEKVYREIMTLNEVLEDYNRYIIRGEEISKEEIDIKRILEEVLEEIKTDKNIRFKKEIESMNIYANKLLLKKAFLNIIKNAIEAIKKEGIISIKTEKKNKKGRIIIEDTGKGMDEKILKRATEPFFTTKARGLGLGFTFVKKVAEMHGFELKIESEKGKGTKVIIDLNL